MEILLYLALIVFGYLAELHDRIDTNTIMKKLAIGAVILGALIALGGRDNPLIEVGVVIYFIDRILEVYCYPKNRRQGDKWHLRRQ